MHKIHYFFIFFMKNQFCTVYTCYLVFCIIDRPIHYCAIYILIEEQGKERKKPFSQKKEESTTTSPYKIIYFTDLNGD